MIAVPQKVDRDAHSTHADTYVFGCLGCEAELESWFADEPPETISTQEQAA